MESVKLTAAPSPLIMVDGDKETEYTMHPLSDLDFDSLDRWIQSQVVAITRNSLKEQVEEGEVSNEQYEEEMAIAVRAAIGVSLYEPRGAAVINTPRGVARLAWQSTRKSHPDVPFATFVPLCRILENYSEIVRVFALLNRRDVTKKITEQTEDSDPNE